MDEAALMVVLTASKVKSCTGKGVASMSSTLEGSMSSALELIANLIAQVGFPIFVSVWLLWRIEGALYRLGESIRLLTIILARQQGVSVDDIKRQFGINGGEIRPSNGR